MLRRMEISTVQLLHLLVMVRLIGGCTNNGNKTDGAGIFVSGEIVECKYLQQQLPDDIHEVYSNRVQMCTQKTTDCCKTCDDILTCQDHTLYILGTHYDCKYLRTYYTEDKLVGIYENRLDLCNTYAIRQQCCESCQVVNASTHVTSSNTPGTTQSIPGPQVTTIQSTPEPSNITSTTREYEDTCVSSCIWVADGAYGTCDLLRKSTNNVHKDICRQGLAPGCKRTCHDILKEQPNVIVYSGVDKSSEKSVGNLKISVVGVDSTSSAVTHAHTTMLLYTLCFITLIISH